MRADINVVLGGRKLFWATVLMNNGTWETALVRAANEEEVKGMGAFGAFGVEEVIFRGEGDPLDEGCYMPAHDLIYDLATGRHMDYDDLLREAEEASQPS
jgi:hypothetical protein